jgi:hypothetical protein
MNYETIEDEVYNFVDDFFDDELYLTEQNLDFIENNNLYTPNVDYSYLHHFLSDLITKFQVVDPDFAPPIVIKLNHDINYLKDIYQKYLDKTKDSRDIFKNNFIPSSSVINDYTTSILEVNKKEEKSAQEFKQLKHMKQNLIKLKEKYYPIFEDVFYENAKNIDDDFKIAINTKIFYFDKLLWLSAYESQSIVNHVRIRKLDGEFNAISYLKLIMSIMRPYSDEYKYLTQCLKVYTR